MRIDHDLATFLTSPVMIILGTCDAHGRSEIGRGVGARVHSNAGAVEVLVSEWQWPGTIAHIRDTARAAITFARPTDYVTYQLKGRARIIEADANALELSARYIHDVTALLCELGLPRRLIGDWLTHREAVLIHMEVDAIYLQTPGANAGQLVASLART